MTYEDWLAWLAKIPLRRSFSVVNLLWARPTLNRDGHTRHIARALEEGHVLRATLVGGEQRYRYVEKSTGGR